MGLFSSSSFGGGGLDFSFLDDDSTPGAGATAGSERGSGLAPPRQSRLFKYSTAPLTGHVGGDLGGGGGGGGGAGAAGAGRRHRPPGIPSPSRPGGRDGSGNGSGTAGAANETGSSSAGRSATDAVAQALAAAGVSSTVTAAVDPFGEGGFFS
jgi:hypothetical protein